jgi:hypothetical protein
MRTHTRWVVRPAAILFVAALLATSLAAAPAQTVTGTIVGRVIEPGGAGIEGVLVRLESLTNGFQYADRTDGDGYYRLEFLPPDLYRITASRDGYLAGGIERYQAEVNKTKAITPPPITLYPASAPGPAAPSAEARLQVNTVDASLRGGSSRDVVAALPLPGIRSFDTLALLVPGVAPAPETFGASGPGVGPGVGTAGAFSVHGQRARSNNFTIDGSDNNDQDVGVRRQGFTATIPQPVETIVEFEITTLLADAEAGRNTGGQVNVVTRNGSNRLHGQAYGYFTDSALNARDFFDYSGTLPDAFGDPAEENPAENPFTRVQAGGTVGFPLAPDRAHLFAAFERQEVHRTSELHFATPTRAERNAALQAPGAGSLVGADVLVPGFYPEPNDPGGPYGPNTYTQLAGASGEGTLVAVKLDAQRRLFDLPSTFSARYSFTDDETEIPSVDNAVRSSLLERTRSHNVALSLNQSVGERVSNQVRFSFGRTSLAFDEVAGSPFVFETEFGTSGPIGRLLIVPYSPLGVDPFTFPQGRANNTFQIADTLVYARGGHTLKLGADVRRVQLNSFLDRNYRAQVSFTPGFVLRFDDAGNPETTVESGLGLAALGAPSDIFQSLALTPDSHLALRFVETNLFVHDTWRVHPRVTVTLGLRYEYNTVPEDATGRLERALALTSADFARDADDPAEDFFFDALEAQRRVLGGRERIYDPDRNNVAPRVGVAWDLTGDGRASLRAGYGLYYDTILGTVVSQSRNVFPAFLPVNLGTGVLFPGILSANPVFLGLVAPGTLNTLPVAPADLPRVLGELLFVNGFDIAFTLPEKRLRTPYVHHYALTLERALGDRYVAAASYAGTGGRKLLRPRTPNGGQFTTLLVAPQFGGAAPQVIRPDRDLGAYTIVESSARSSYNALELSLERRPAGGLGFHVAYTYAHAIDELSDVFDLAGAFALAQDELGREGGLRAERGDANFDVRHRFTAAWLYELFGGYELAGVATLQTGQPFTVNTSVDVNLDGNLTDRLATAEGLERRDEGPVRLVLAPGVSPASLLPIDRAGAVGRNTFRARGVASVDLALGKRFELGGGRSATVRLEAFNVFNRTHFGIPVRLLEAPGFGRSTYTTLPARTLQLAVRYSF